VIYSGTVAAAIEAAFLGCPSIAVSLHLKNGVPVEFCRRGEACARNDRSGHATRAATGPDREHQHPRASPKRKAGGYKGRPSMHTSLGRYLRRASHPRGQKYFWNSSVFKLGTTDADTDVAAVRTDTLR